MANKNFQVKFGLEVGSTVTADAATGNITTSGDVAVNGGDITTTSATMNIANANATAVNIAGAGTAVSIGAATGTTTINNANTVVTGDLAVNGGDITTTSTGTATVFNTNATTVNMAGAGTAVTIGANTGTLTIGNPTVVGTQTTQNLYNTTATTVNAFGAATAVSIGAATGTTTINNANTVAAGDLAVNGGDITTTQTTATVFNTNATTVNAFGAGTAVAIGANTGTLTIGNPTVVGTQATQNLYNTVATTLNIGGGATTAVNIGNSSGEIITPSDIKITGNKSIRDGDGPYTGSTDIYRDQAGVATEGIQISNNNMTNASSALVIRNYGQSTSGGGVNTQGPAQMHLLGTRGTAASPLAVNTANSMAQITIGTNYGDTTGAGTGNGWSNDLFPITAQAGQIDFLANENHRQAPVAVFTGSIGGTTLTVTAVTSGTITPGHQIRATGLSQASAGIIILRQLTSTAAGNAQGSTGTYQLSAAAGLGSTTITSYSLSSSVAMRIGVMPNVVGGTATSAVPNNTNMQRITVIPSNLGGAVTVPISQIAVQPGWNSFPVSTRIINAITGGNTLDIGTHNFTAGAGVSFQVTTAGNPNGLTTGTTYFIDTVPSSTTITLRTSTTVSSPVTGLTNGTNLFISANTAGQCYDGTRNTANLNLIGPRQGYNYFGTGVPPFLDVNRFNDQLGFISFSGYRNGPTLNAQTAIAGRCTEDWTSSTNIGSEIIINTSKAGTGVITSTQIGAGATAFITDSFNITNTSSTSMSTLSSTGNLTIAGDLRVNGNDIQASDGNNNITLTSNTLTTFAGDIRVNGNDIQNSTGNTTITMNTGAGARTIFAGDIEVDGNNIRASDGNINTTLTSNTLTTFAGDIRINGNDIQNSTGTNNIQLSSTNTVIQATQTRFISNPQPTVPSLYSPLIQPGTPTSPTIFSINGASPLANQLPLINFQNVRFDGTNLSPTQSGDQLGQYKFNGNTASSGSTISVPAGPGASITAIANENWTNTANGTNFNFVVIKKGTITDLTALSLSSDATTMRGDQINLQDSSSVGIVSGKIDYNRVFGQWQYDATITPAAANTAYAFPFQGVNAVTDYANIAAATNTSRINTNAIGYFKLQFSIQLENTDNGADHTAYIWWRKNGVDIANSMGRVYVTKQHQTIAGWDNVVQATATTDYFELMYAVDNVALIFPYNAATAFGPAAAAAFISIVPIGA